MKKLINQPTFREWIEHSLGRQDNILAISNQGTLLRYQQDGFDLVVKAAMGRGLLRKIRERTLAREYLAYQRMEGLSGVPRCFGMVDGRYLVIEYVNGKPYREAEWTDREQWFVEFLAVLQAIHRSGVSHGDLKSKSNIIVTADEKPCVIDFGTALLHKAGFHPINNRLFDHGRQMDINAWVKHKYHGRYDQVEGPDLELLNFSPIEYYVRKLRGRPVDVIPGRKGD